MTSGGAPDRKGLQRVSIAELVWATGRLRLRQSSTATSESSARAIKPNAITRHNTTFRAGGEALGKADASLVSQPGPRRRDSAKELMVQLCEKSAGNALWEFLRRIVPLNPRPRSTPSVFGARAGHEFG